MTSQSSTMPRRVEHRSGASIICAALTAFATTIGICGVANATGSQSQVTYQLSGSAPVADYISYQTDSGQTQQANVPLPWTTQFNVVGTKVYVISAQSPGIDHVHDPARRQGGQPSDRERGACPHRLLALTFRPAPANQEPVSTGVRGFGGG